MFSWLYAESICPLCCPVGASSPGFRKFTARDGFSQPPARINKLLVGKHETG
ncbi:hypothetical protein APY04_2944 [Hyphomicrobium sulfonivorans]|uniref:Uncharacterized protein n=1 Tax=Hyphomicrobium sulfonivorans TaxID=121290 RepID=A0A109BAU1_HYPSL|nr:hypothetical protein APY04_2944 [Hyphomicrobium sulfonivorans]